jgi:hypothetical protein
MDFVAEREIVATGAPCAVRCAAPLASHDTPRVVGQKHDLHSFSSVPLCAVSHSDERSSKVHSVQVYINLYRLFDALPPNCGPRAIAVWLAAPSFQVQGCPSSKWSALVQSDQP